MMLGDRPATVSEVRTFDLHGVAYTDVALTFEDGVATSARLGPEAVPETLQAGDHVVVTMAAGLVLSLRKP
jgi:hypothetical protein